MWRSLRELVQDIFVSEHFNLFPYPFVSEAVFNLPSVHLNGILAGVRHPDNVGFRCFSRLVWWRRRIVWGGGRNRGGFFSDPVLQRLHVNGPGFSSFDFFARRREKIILFILISIIIG